MLGVFQRNLFFRDRHMPKQRGIALLAVAAALVVAGGASVFTLRNIQSDQGLQEEITTRNSLIKIRDSLLLAAYQDTDFELPCPSDPNGAAAGFGNAAPKTNGICDVTRGIVPWSDIGLAEADVLDTTGGYVTYIVDNTSSTVCSLGSATSGSLDDLNTAAATDALFALIDHGQNSDGGVRSEDNFAAVPDTAVEVANCPVGSVDNPCAPPNTDEFRSGPVSGSSTDFFDDIVLSVAPSSVGGVSDSCLELAGEDTTENTATGSDTSSSLRAVTEIFTETAEDTSAGVQTQGTDEGTTVTVGADSLQSLTFGGSPDGSLDTRICRWTENVFPIDDATSGENDNQVIRAFFQFGSESEMGTDRGNGLVVGFMERDLITTGGSFTVSSTTCGGEGGELMGWEDGSGGRALPSTERFALELDNRPHQGVGGNEDNFDNHVAIVIDNVEHAGTDNGQNGPLCDIDTSPSFGSLRTDGLTDTQNSFSAFPDEPLSTEGCWVNEPEETTAGNSNDSLESTWFEDGNTNASAFHQVRIEVHNDYNAAGSEATAASCNSATEVLMRVWFWPSDATSGLQCPTQQCDNLTEDYEDIIASTSSVATDPPAISQCVDYQGGNYVHLGLTTGSDSGTVGDFLRVIQFGATSRRAQALSDPSAAASTADTFELNAARLTVHLDSSNFTGASSATGRYSPIGLSHIDSIGSDNAEISSRLGRLSVTFDNSTGGDPEDHDTDESIGVQGIGDDDEAESSNDTIGNFFDTNLSSFNPFGERESIDVRFPSNGYRRVGLSLGSFERNANSNLEQAIIDLYRNDTFVKRQIVDGCDSPLGNDSSVHKAIIIQSTDAEGTFNRVRITPNPQANTSRSDASGFNLRGIKMCGNSHSCGVISQHECVERFDVSDNYPVNGIAVGTNEETATYTVDFIENLYDDSSETTGDSLLPGANFTIGLGDNDYSFLHARNNRDDANSFDPYLDVHANNDQEQVSLRNVGSILEGFGYDSSTGNDARVDGGAALTDETITIRWPRQWARVLLSVGGFGQNSGEPERLQLQAYTGSTTVGSAQILSACDTGDDSGSGWIEVDYEALVAASTVVDRIDITALGTATSDLESDFVVRAVKACEAGHNCTMSTSDLPSATIGTCAVFDNIANGN